MFGAKMQIVKSGSPTRCARQIKPTTGKTRVSCTSLWDTAISRKCVCRQPPVTSIRASYVLMTATRHSSFRVVSRSSLKRATPRLKKTKLGRNMLIKWSRCPRYLIRSTSNCPSPKCFAGRSSLVFLLQMDRCLRGVITSMASSASRISKWYGFRSRRSWPSRTIPNASLRTSHAATITRSPCPRTMTSTCGDGAWRSTRTSSSLTNTWTRKWTCWEWSWISRTLGLSRTTWFFTSIGSWCVDRTTRHWLRPRANYSLWAVMTWANWQSVMSWVPWFLSSLNLEKSTRLTRTWESLTWDLALTALMSWPRLRQVRLKCLQRVTMSLVNLVTRPTLDRKRWLR